MHSLFLPLYYKINTYTTNIYKTYFRCIVCMKGISRSVPCYLNLAQISYLELKLAESVAGKKLNSSFFKYASIFTFFVYWHCAILKILQQFCKVQGQPTWWYIWMVYIRCVNLLRTTSEHFINTFKKSLKPVDYWSHTSVSLIVGRAPDL